MSVIEDAVEVSADVAGEVAAYVSGPAAELASDVAIMTADAVMEGVESAGDLVDAAIDEGGSLLVKLLVLAGLAAIAVFIWKRMNATDDVSPDVQSAS